LEYIQRGAVGELGCSQCEEAVGDVVVSVDHCDELGALDCSDRGEERRRLGLGPVVVAHNRDSFGVSLGDQHCNRVGGRVIVTDDGDDVQRAWVGLGGETLQRGSEHRLLVTRRYEDCH